MSERNTVAALRLCDFILVVGENEVLTAAVNVNRVAEEAMNHCRALNVPTGSALAPGRVPIGLAGLCAFPKGEIHRLLFKLADIYSRTRFEVLQRLMRKLAVLGELFRAEVDIAVLNGISISLFNKC